MSGARQRALAVHKILVEQNLAADLYVGLEGGFHSISVEGTGTLSCAVGRL